MQLSISFRPFHIHVGKRICHEFHSPFSDQAHSFASYYAPSYFLLWLYLRYSVFCNRPCLSSSCLLHWVSNNSATHTVYPILKIQPCNSYLLISGLFPLIPSAVRELRCCSEISGAWGDGGWSENRCLINTFELIYRSLTSCLLI